MSVRSGRPAGPVIMPATVEELAERWPLIALFLEVTESGQVRDRYLSWSWGRARYLEAAEVAAGYEEWARFFEWRLEQRAEELSTNRGLRHSVEEWTVEMTYFCRRAAAQARGEDPGEWVDLCVRCPEIDAEGRTIVDEIIARLDPHNDLDRPLVAGVA